jgi:hypothetical protein
MRTRADGMVEMHEKNIGKQQLCELLNDLIDVRCDGKLIIIPLSLALLPYTLVLMLQMTRESFTCGTGGSSSSICRHGARGRDGGRRLL